MQGFFLSLKPKQNMSNSLILRPNTHLSLHQTKPIMGTSLHFNSKSVSGSECILQNFDMYSYLQMYFHRTQVPWDQAVKEAFYMLKNGHSQIGEKWIYDNQKTEYWHYLPPAPKKPQSWYTLKTKTQNSSKKFFPRAWKQTWT